jgi:chitin disaccharide deacetylase
MPVNPLLRKLGFSATDRVAIIHTDDIGVTESCVDAAADLWRTKIISSSAVMVPCAWFPATARLCRATPGIDMGVHITLTSEWDLHRWGPISNRDPRSGLVDREGYFPRTQRAFQEAADPNAAETEIVAQIERALAAGIDVTHIDSHMGTVFHTSLLSAYVRTGLRFQVPAMLPRLTASEMVDAWGIDPSQVPFMLEMIEELDAHGMPLMDHIVGMPLDKPEHRFEALCAALDALPAGLSYFIVHPSKDTPEARAAYPDLPARIGDYETLMDERTRAHIKNTGLHVIGYRELRDAMRA